MLETRYSKFLTVLLIVIILAVLGLLGYLGYSYYKEYSMKKDADAYVSEFTNSTGITEQGSGNVIDTNSVGNPNEITNTSIEATNVTGNNSGTQTYRGYEIIGTLEIPKIDIRYPIYQAPPTPKKLELSIAAVSPATAKLNTVGNIVILGHNYRNGSFFSNLKKLEEGDKIYATDLDKKKVEYTVKSKFTTTKDETSFYNRDTDGKMELTLSTCADDSSVQRVIIEAVAN